jgi:hypothetical protein
MISNVYAPCPCGSGKKYKFCCFQKDREKARKNAGANPYTPRLSLLILEFEVGFHEADVLSDNESEDKDIIAALGLLKEHLPSVTEVKSDHNNLHAALARRRVEEFLRQNSTYTKAEIIQAINIIEDSVRTHDIHGKRGYLNFLGGFMRKLGVRVERATPLDKPE